MTKRLAIIGSVLAVIVFVGTLTRPNALSEWPPIVQAVANAAGVFVAVWLFIPLIAYVAYLALTPLRWAFGRSGKRDT